MNELVKIRPYASDDEMELVANAAADGHGVYYPNHVIVKEKRIVGYLSINQLPLILSWQDSQRMGPTDSLKEIGYIEGALCQFKNFCIPCDPESPYMRFLPKAGYHLYGKPVHLFLKGDK